MANESMPVYPVYKYSEKTFSDGDILKEKYLFGIGREEHEARSIILEEIDRLDEFFRLNDPYRYKRSIENDGRTIRYDPIDAEDEFDHDIWAFWYEERQMS